MHVSFKMSLLVLMVVCQMMPTTVAAQPSTGLSLDGVWVVGEEGDPPEQRIEISGLTGTIQPLLPFEGKDPDPLTVAVEEGPSRFSLTIPYVRYPYQVRLFSESHGIVWQRDDDDLLYLYRLEPPAPDFEGDWVVLAEGDVGLVSIDGTNITIVIGDRVNEGEVYQTGADPPYTNLVMLSQGRESEIFHLVPLNDNAYLAYTNGDDDLVFLYREDAQPDWLNVADWMRGDEPQSIEVVPY